jgi:hypothetical protein
MAEYGFFEALLTPYESERPEVVADLSLDAVSEDDQELLAPGASFYLHAGRYEGVGGRTFSFTSIRLRRLGKWRTEDIEYIREKAVKWRNAFDVDAD